MLKKKRVYLGIAAAVALVLGTGTNALAEGSITSYVYQVQPHFGSRSWVDHAYDDDHTIVTLTNCAGNHGGNAATAGFISSVGISLLVDGVVKQTITKRCGSYDFGKRGGASYYIWEVTSINGVTTSTSNGGDGTFLNADVKWSW